VRILARSVAVTLAATTTIAISACSPPEKKSDSASGSAATAASAADLGGIDALAAAAKKEGQLNVIALPPDWANYGAIIKAFGDKYGIKVNSAQPDGSSQDEINAADQLKGQGGAPDVFDLSGAVASANTAKFAPYKVATFAEVPDALKDAAGTWVNDYGGYMSIGYDSAKVPAPATVADLLKPEYKGKVALNGDPTQASAGYNGVLMASVANGGSADDIAPGVDYFKKLAAAGNFLPVDPTPATIESGQTPVVFDWDYLQAAQVDKLKAKGVDWKIYVPDNAVVGGYYYQAINAGAPHPACARLWQEYLYSPDGQNEFLRGGARPVLADQMKSAGTLDAAAFAKLPPVTGAPIVSNADQVKTGTNVLNSSWKAAVGG
jgi:putative spermidine/putrescine transport system substrate-binding protein